MRLEGSASLRRGLLHFWRSALPEYVAGLIAQNRAKAMPCTCDLHDENPHPGCEVIGRDARQNVEHERLLCPCGATFQRVWIK